MFNPKKITNIFLILSIAVFLFGSGFRLGEYNTRKNSSSFASVNFKNVENQAQSKNLDFSLFWQVWDNLQQKYIDKKKLDPQKMFYGAIKGMVFSLGDSYTFFLTPDENKQSKNDLEGKFDGIGAQLGLDNNQIIIVAPLKNSPAELAGVKAGDYIIKVDDQSTKNWTLTTAVNKIRGKKGTKVKLTLERNKNEFEVTITRNQINVPSIEISYETKNNKKIAILNLNQFGDNTNQEWDKAVTQIKTQWDQKQISGMVLNLRDNPGGYLEGAVYLASEFLPLGKVVVKQEATTSENKTYYVLRNGKLKDIPLVVLINKGSASASEILAGAIRDYKRGKLVGEKSFGKGSIQEAIDLETGAGLHITVAKWILPNGDWINDKGIEPDVKVENKIKNGNTLTRASDTQLDKAIEQLTK